MEYIDIETTLSAGVSDAGGWNKAQFALIGITWPPLRGWKAALIRDGFKVPTSTHTEFQALRKGGPRIDG